MRQRKPKLNAQAGFKVAWALCSTAAFVGGHWDFRFIECPNGWMANVSGEIVGAHRYRQEASPCYRWKSCTTAKDSILK
jgi:hypothetical protein